MRLLAFFVAALSAAVSLEAQTPAPGTTAAAPAAPVAQVAQGTVTVCGQPVAPPSNVPPAGSGPVIFRIVLCFEKQGGYPMVEANTYLYYIQLQAVGLGQVDSLRRSGRADDSRGLQAAVGDDLPRRPGDPGRGLPLPERRHRQDGRLRHGRARAGQDRRLRGPGQGRPVEDRRGAQGEEHHHPPRLLHRSRQDPQRRRRRPRALCRRGLSVRRDPAGDQAGGGRAEAGARDVSRH